MDTFFSDYKIIGNDLANICCDQIMFNIREQFDFENPRKDNMKDRFALSGRLASNLQLGEEIPIRNVVFITDSEEIFKYHRDNAKKISPSSTGIIKFKNQTLVNFDYLFIEIWFSEGAMELGKFEDLPVQLISQIPLETL